MSSFAGRAVAVALTCALGLSAWAALRLSDGELTRRGREGERLEQARTASWLALGGWLATSALAAAWLVSLSRRTRALAADAEAISRGDLGRRARTDGGDAVARIAGALNAMAERIDVRNREVAALSQMGELLQACFTLEEAFGVVARLAPLMIPAPAGAVYVRGAEPETFERVAHWGAREGTLSTFSSEQCWAARRGQSYLVRDTRTEIACAHLGQPAPEGQLCIPLTAQGDTLGILHLRLISGEGASALGLSFTDTDRRITEAVADQLALAIANLRLRDTLRNQAIRDPLTGLFNRRYLEETLERELSRARRGYHPVSLLVIDVDHFKRFNDTYGHPAGDALLSATGNLLRSVVRAEDIACRYGGEEFVVVMPEASADDALFRAEQLRAAARALRVAHGGRELGEVTVSIGVATFPEHSSTGETLFQLADNALYRAKREGRDRVIAAPSAATAAA